MYFFSFFQILDVKTAYIGFGGGFTPGTPVSTSTNNRYKRNETKVKVKKEN